MAASKSLLLEHAITPIQNTATVGKTHGSAMIIDAMDILYSAKQTASVSFPVTAIYPSCHKAEEAALGSLE